MSKWILIGPLVGVLLITLALVFGYVIVPPLIVERITEVKEKYLVAENNIEQTLVFLVICLNI